MNIFEAGQVMRMVRRASHLALNDAKVKGQCANPLNAAILIYTDCPMTALWVHASKDMPEICGVSQIEGTCCTMGEDFPPAAFEAERVDLDMPRIAAMFFHARGVACPRCRKKHTAPGLLCERCASVVS
jgi:hypothetical protein